MVTVKIKHVNRNSHFTSLPIVYELLSSPMSEDLVFNNIKEQLKDTKGVIRSRKSKFDRQYNGQKKKDKRTNNDLQNMTQKRERSQTRNSDAQEG